MEIGKMIREFKRGDSGIRFIGGYRRGKRDKEIKCNNFIHNIFNFLLRIFPNSTA
jgi:hypothetical protein